MTNGESREYDGGDSIQGRSFVGGIYDFDKGGTQEFV